MVCRPNSRSIRHRQCPARPRMRRCVAVAQTHRIKLHRKGAVNHPAFVIQIPSALIQIRQKRTKLSFFLTHGKVKRRLLQVSEADKYFGEGSGCEKDKISTPPPPHSYLRRHSYLRAGGLAASGEAAAAE